LSRPKQKPTSGKARERKRKLTGGASGPSKQNATSDRSWDRRCTIVQWSERRELAGVANPAVFTGQPGFLVGQAPPSGDDYALRLPARAIVSVLLGLPQPTATEAEVLNCGRKPSSQRGKDQVTDQAGATLSYRELSERYIWNGRIDVSKLRRLPRRRDPYAGAFEEYSRLLIQQRRKELREISDSGTETPMIEPMSDPTPMVSPKRRPGRGGRMRRRTIFSESTATAELRAEIGDPHRAERIHGVEYSEWQLGGYGDGAIFARLSGQELNGGETVIGQILGLRRLAEQAEKTVKYIIITTNNSGAQAPEARPDLVRMNELISQGLISWVGFRDTSRIARIDITRAVTYHLLQQTGVELYLSTLDRAVNWDADEATLFANGFVDQQERRNIIERTQGPIITRRLAEGLGRPGVLPFGFYWDKEEHRPKVDPVQWPYIKQVHYAYDHEAHTRRRGSFTRVLEQLASSGCELSDVMIRNILRNPIYVTGEYTAGWQGQRVSCKPIPIADPIPMELYQRNQETMALTRGRNSVVPPGFFALNGVEFLHAACRHQTVKNPASRKPEQVQPHLRGRIYGKRKVEPAYVHEPIVPADCKRWTMPQRVIEPVVMQALRELAGSEILREEWLASQHYRSAPQTRILTAEKRSEVRGELRRLEAQVEEIEARRVDPDAVESSLGSQDYLDLVVPSKRKAEQLRRQLVADEVMAKPITAPQVEGHLRPLAKAAELEDEAIYAELKQALDEILTDEVPEDLDMLRRRAAIVKVAISRIIVDDDYERGTFTLQLEGPLVPPGYRTTGQIGPVASAQTILEAYVAEKDAKDEQANCALEAADGECARTSDAQKGDPICEGTGTGSIHTPGCNCPLVTRGVNPSNSEGTNREAGGETDSVPAPLPYEEVRDLFYKLGAGKSTRKPTYRARSDSKSERSSWAPLWISPPLRFEGRFRPLPPLFARAIEGVRLIHAQSDCLLCAAEYDRAQKTFVRPLAGGPDVYHALAAAGLTPSFDLFRDWALGLSDGSELGIAPDSIYAHLHAELPMPPEAKDRAWWPSGNQPGDADAS
jgi:DNA invertase Pin-like site-specific DNA recombinase